MFFSRTVSAACAVIMLTFFCCFTLFAGGEPEAVSKPAGDIPQRETGVEYPVTIEDDYGNLGGQENHIIVLKEPVEKVIVGEKGCALVLLEFEISHKVVAAGEWIVSEIPGYEEIPSIGGSFMDIELILGLNPDIVITLFSNSTQSTAQLARAGIPVYTVGAVRNLEHIKEHIFEYGLMFDKQDAARDIIEEMNAKEGKAAELTAAKNLREEDKPRVFMFGPMGDLNTLQTWAPAGETIVDDIIRKAGGRCLAAEQGLTGWPQYSLEALLESDPEIIILPLSEAEFSSVEEFTSMDLVQSLQAVRNNRVYGIDSSLLFDLSYKTATALLKFAQFINE